MDSRSLPSDATKASRIRYQLAQEVAQACPPELGREIALTGSVSRGLADDDSDIEWLTWVETLPSAEERVAWLREVGATEIIPAERAIGDGSIWAWSRYSGVCLETGWQTVGEQE